jgi:hypothetical protein
VAETSYRPFGPRGRSPADRAAGASHPRAASSPCFASTTTTPSSTLRVRYLALPGRLTVLARRPTLHLPAHWPWRWRWAFALARLRCIPNPI